jgi:hypothetical protein
MNHRWGNRIAVDFPVRVRNPASLGSGAAHIRTGRLINLSLDGALIAGRSEVPIEARVQIAIDAALNTLSSATLIDAYLVRKADAAFAIQWAEFAPAPIVALVREMGTRSAQTLLERDLSLHTTYSRSD